MIDSRSSQGGWIAPTLAGVIAFVILAAPVTLHFTQMRHNRVPSVDDRFPPTSRPAPGEVYASTAALLIDHELSSWTGWRSNDFFLWGPTLWADNNANRQMGILQATRESMRVFKDNLTKVSSDRFDDNLVEADSAFRADPYKFWLPSAESRFRAGTKSLRQYVSGLKKDPPASRPINQRNIELIKLFQAWTDLLGGAHADLYNDNAGWFETDDFFYRAQGYAHAMHHLTRAVHREYAESIDGRPVLTTLFQEVARALERAARMKPIVVLDGSPSGIFANHRRNLAIYLSEARQKMYSIREELEK